MHSCIYDGHVHHQRYGPVEHGFRYVLYLMYLDLDELDSVFRHRWLWSARRPAMARFRREDHLGDPAQPLDESVRQLVFAEAGFRPSGPIRLLTHLRYFGYVINPVSFYFCFDNADSQVEAVVAEVNNTPWGERHCYVIDAREAGCTNGLRDNTESASNLCVGQRTIRAEHEKQLHVSPFLPMKMKYRWRISEPADQLNVHVTNYRDNGRQFDATLALRRSPVTTVQLARVLMRYPFMTSRVVAGIYWQAMRLWFKGVAFHTHPQR